MIEKVRRYQIVYPLLLYFAFLSFALVLGLWLARYGKAQGCNYFSPVQLVGFLGLKRLRPSSASCSFPLKGPNIKPCFLSFSPSLSLTPMRWCWWFHLLTFSKLLMDFSELVRKRKNYPSHYYLKKIGKVVKRESIEFCWIFKRKRRRKKSRICSLQKHSLWIEKQEVYNKEMYILSDFSMQLQLLLL